MSWSTPDVTAVRDCLRNLVDADVDLDRLEMNYLQAGQNGPARILYQAPRRSGGAVRVTACRVDISKGRKFEAAINSTHGSSQPALYSPSLGLLFQVFPADHRLPLLTVAVDKTAMLLLLRSALAHRAGNCQLWDVVVNVVRYKPERKCLLRYDLSWSGGQQADLPSTVWARMSRPAKFAKTRNILPRLHAVSDQLGFDLPEPLGELPELCMELFGSVPGAALFSLVQTAEFPKLCRRVGEALCRFHALPLKVDEVMDVDAQVTRLEENTKEFGWLMPEERKRIEAIEAELAARLRAVTPSRLQFIHRDVHGDNLLVTDGHLSLIDFEDCAMGEPADDVGSNWAQLTWHCYKAGRSGASLPEAARREFLAGYLEHADAATAWCVPTYAALHCYLYAHQCLRHPTDAGRYNDARAMLGTCENVLERGVAL